MGTNKKDKSQVVAIKVINKHALDEADLEGLKNEVAIMQQVDHPNIVNYYETYDDKQYIYLVMEFCTGGDLLDKVIGEDEGGEYMSEMEIAKLF